MRTTIITLAFAVLSACTTVVFAPAPGSQVVGDAGTLGGDGSVAPDAWIVPTADGADAGIEITRFDDAGPTEDAATLPAEDAAVTAHCDADELLDAPAGRCWSYNVTDGACAPGREVGWWSTTDEQARVQTLMASLTTNALVNTALIRNGSGSWVWQGHSGVTPQVNWVSPHPLGTDQHAALSRTGMQADSFPLASGAGTLCVRSL